MRDFRSEPGVSWVKGWLMLIRGLVILAVGLLAGPIVRLAQAQEGDPRFRTTGQTEITGVVRVRGCTLDPALIDLRAQPFRVGNPASREFPDERAANSRARLEATADPHTFSFAIRGLQPIRPYQITIFTPAHPVCGTLFWRGDSNGVAVSGGLPIAIEGVAATTQLEIYDPLGDGWVGVDHLDFTDPVAATRRLRWRSTVPYLTGGELQISTLKFPTAGEFGACDEPAGGVIYRQQVPAVQQDWSVIDALPFQRILSRQVTPGDGVGSPTTGISPSALRLLYAGAPLYLRVVPVADTGPACNAGEQGVPGWVIVAKVPEGAPVIPEPPPAPPALEAGQRQRYRPAHFHMTPDDGLIHPTYEEYAYRAVKEHTLPTQLGCNWQLNQLAKKSGAPIETLPAYSDYIACELIRNYPNLEGATVQVGQWFYFPMTFSGGGSSFLENLATIVTAVPSTLGVGVNFFADIYNGAVEGVKKLAFEILVKVDPLGICQKYPDQCKQGIEIGMTYAMTSVGLPPSIPNWDEMKQEGLDYFAHELADRLKEEGVPEDLTEEGLRLLTQEIINQMTAKRGSETNLAFSWIERFSGFAPASWSTPVYKHGVEPVLGGITFETFPTALFGATSVRLPSTFPPPLPVLDISAIRLPIVLPPNLAGIPPPLCTTTTRTQPHRECVPQTSSFFNVPICRHERWADGGFGDEDPWQMEIENCDRYGDMLQVYYRDAYIKKLQAVPCAPIGGMTLEVVGNLKFPVSGYTYVVNAAVQPLSGLVWDPPAVGNGCAQ